MLSLQQITCDMQATTKSWPTPARHKVQPAPCCPVPCQAGMAPVALVRRPQGLCLTAMGWQHSDSARTGPGLGIALLLQTLQLLPQVLAAAALLTLLWKLQRLMKQPVVKPLQLCRPQSF